MAAYVVGLVRDVENSSSTIFIVDGAPPGHRAIDLIVRPDHHRD